MVGNEMLTMPALNDHKNIPRAKVKITEFSLVFKVHTPVNNTILKCINFIKRL